MKLVRFILQGETCYGRLEGERVIEVKDPGHDWLKDAFNESGRSFAASDVTFLAPCQPSKVICLGLNYRSHAREMNLPLPEQPIIFIKPSTAVIGPAEKIIYPPESRRVDYEAELGVVIGRKTYRVNSADALEYVFGYTCANDVTARDKQPADGQWTYAKSFDTFSPLGPVIETAIEDPDNLQLRGYLNGSLVQVASTADHHFKVAEIIAYISNCMTLLPGDVIMTGTPSGIGPLEPGDRFAVVIDEIGTLENEIACL